MRLEEIKATHKQHGEVTLYLSKEFNMIGPIMDVKGYRLTAWYPQLKQQAVCVFDRESQARRALREFLSKCE